MEKETLHCKVTVRIMTDRKAFGPGVAEILTGIRKYHSLRGAARQMGMSYTKAWTIIREAEKIWGFSLTQRHAGGKEGGSSVLTEPARIVLERYEAMSRELHELAEQKFQQYFNEEELRKLRK
ncbi:MAG: LysR family transcriptional regulator [Megasphaera sp.]|jgi:molybdate transport repressor ModE-like protein|nr:LysR family transcriptional regulator [Megasphaera sp.]MCI1248167.1 LysR family transcriptional regulator [Megasphaera sp.]